MKKKKAKKKLRISIADRIEVILNHPIAIKKIEVAKRLRQQNYN